MNNALNALWNALFVAAVQFPIAAVVSGVVGVQSGLMFWVMGTAAHLRVRLTTDLSMGRLGPIRFGGRFS